MKKLTAVVLICLLSMNVSAALGLELVLGSPSSEKEEREKYPWEYDNILEMPDDKTVVAGVTLDSYTVTWPQQADALAYWVGIERTPMEGYITMVTPGLINRGVVETVDGTSVDVRSTAFDGLVLDPDATALDIAEYINPNNTVSSGADATARFQLYMTVIPKSGGTVREYSIRIPVEMNEVAKEEREAVDAILAIRATPLPLEVPEELRFGYDMYIDSAAFIFDFDSDGNTVLTWPTIDGASEYVLAIGVTSRLTKEGYGQGELVEGYPSHLSTEEEKYRNALHELGKYDSVAWIETEETSMPYPDEARDALERAATDLMETSLRDAGHINEMDSINTLQRNGYELKYDLCYYLFYR